MHTNCRKLNLKLNPTIKNGQISRCIANNSITAQKSPNM